MRDFNFRKIGLKSVGLAALLAVFLPAHAAEKTTYFHFDALGSPVAATDQAGNVVWKEEYRPYGARIKQEPAAASNTRWYTGHPQDNDTGLTYMGARYYDPMVGRFMATDPKGFSEDNIHSFNRYAYANNNPYKFVDPDGREAFARGLGDVPENPVAGPGTAITAGIIASPLLFTVGGVVVAKEAISHVTGIPLGLKGMLQGLGKGFARGVAKGANTSTKVKDVLRQLEDAGAKGPVKRNPLKSNQEKNVTIEFKNGDKLNLRVETHPLKKNGPPVRHGNAELVTRTNGRKKVINRHIFDE